MSIPATYNWSLLLPVFFFHVFNDLGKSYELMTDVPWPHPWLDGVHGDLVIMEELLQHVSYLRWLQYETPFCTLFRSSDFLGIWFCDIVTLKKPSFHKVSKPFMWKVSDIFSKQITNTDLEFCLKSYNILAQEWYGRVYASVVHGLI